MNTRTFLAVCTTTLACWFAHPSRAETIRRIAADPGTGSSRAVVVDDLPLVHTDQIFPDLADPSAPAQVASVLKKLDEVLVEAGADPDRVVKLNVVVAKQETVPVFAAALARRFDAERAPAVSYVVSHLPREPELVAVDAISLVAKPATDSPPIVGVQIRPRARILPAGTRIYVAGQAEKGETLAEATRKTLESLQRTLQYVGRDKADIVQLKSFLSPMANVAEARQAMQAFFGDKPLPPTVWVEWQAPLIEIEVVAWGGPKARNTPVDYSTPLGMTTSPVYSRVARTQADQLIYVSSLYSSSATDAAGEVTDIFSQLQELLKQTGSDLSHMAKATYYCSHQDTSTKLNELRPKYYDPKRPPAASKAMVVGVGHADRALTIDMIAVPRSK